MRVHAVVRGRVQGVGFRYFVEREAGKLGLTGWVRNRPDGSVECTAQGERAPLDRFVASLHKGPRLASVSGVDLRWEDGDATYSTFEVVG